MKIFCTRCNVISMGETHNCRYCGSLLTSMKGIDGHLIADPVSGGHDREAEVFEQLEGLRQIDAASAVQPLKLIKPLPQALSEATRVSQKGIQSLQSLPLGTLLAAPLNQQK